MPRIQGTQIGLGYMPLVTVEVLVGGQGISGPALVDSGADCTIIPGEAIELLGVDFKKLPPGLASKGAGGDFESRTCTGELRWRQWTICTEFQVSEPGSLEQALLGRSDFFSKFAVRFNWQADPPWVQIDPVDLAMQARSGKTPAKGKRKR